MVPMGSSAPVQIAPYPREMIGEFLYSHFALLAEGSTGVGTQSVWALNGLYDPDVTFTGHQPMYYDQLFTATGPYARYLGMEAQWEIDIINTSTAPIYVCWYLQPGAVDLPSLISCGEKPLREDKMLSQRDTMGSRITFRGRMPIEKIFGIPKQRLVSDDTYSGVYNANPSQVAYGILMVYGTTAIATATVFFRFRFKGKAYSLVASPTS